jgi:LysM repeat protein
MQRLTRFFGLLLVLFLVACGKEGDTAVSTSVFSPTPTPEIGVAFATRAVPTAAVLQLTPTPRPTSTPTPSPTPVLYTIREGDTLLDIALQQRTTVADIEALNPGIQANLLQIGQQIILPPPATAVAQSAVGTAVPLQVQVANLNHVTTPAGAVWLLGEVVNGGDLPVGNVRLSLHLPGQTGEQVADAWTAAAVIPVGKAAPFGVLLPDVESLTGEPFVVVAGGESLADLGSQVLDVVVDSRADETAVTFAEDRVQVNGFVVNESDVPVTQIIVIGTFYGVEGQVVGYYQAGVDGVLLPGEKRPFSFTAVPPGGTAVRVSWLVTAQQANQE